MTDQRSPNILDVLPEEVMRYLVKMPTSALAAIAMACARSPAPAPVDPVTEAAVDQAFKCALDQVQRSGFILTEIDPRQGTARASTGDVTVDEAMNQPPKVVDFLSVTVVPAPVGGAAVEARAYTVSVSAEGAYDDIYHPPTLVHTAVITSGRARLAVSAVKSCGSIS